jgi:L-glutamine---4-(methylsulfanyl)-2-oxobutanoate aminotransferase
MQSDLEGRDGRIALCSRRSRRAQKSEPGSRSKAGADSPQHGCTAFAAAPRAPCRAQAYDAAVRARPARLERLPEQYFTALLTRVAAARATGGAPLLDLGRGNPEVGPPAHIVERLAEAARDPGAHGYAPFRGLSRLREAIAARYASEYGVELDPESEVAVVPGTKTAIVELCLALAERGSTVVLPDPGYPDYPSGVAMAAAGQAALPLEGGRPVWDQAPRDDVAALYLNYPSNPCAVCAPHGVFADTVAYAHETGAAIVHDFAYGDLVFDGRPRESFLATPGAKEVGVEMFSLSKTYGMAGWRLGFVVGNAEIVARMDLLSDHGRAGIFAALQEAAIAALTGPQDSVEARRARYEARRDRVLESLPLPAVSEGTFYVWLELPDGLAVERLLTEARVALAPGEGFGSRGAGYARLSLAVDDDTLDEGLERLAVALT